MMAIQKCNIIVLILKPTSLFFLGYVLKAMHGSGRAVKNYNVGRPGSINEIKGVNAVIPHGATQINYFCHYDN